MDSTSTVTATATPTTHTQRKDFSIKLEDFMGPVRELNLNLKSLPIKKRFVLPAAVAAAAMIQYYDDSTCSSGFHSDHEDHVDDTESNLSVTGADVEQRHIPCATVDVDGPLSSSSIGFHSDHDHVEAYTEESNSNSSEPGQTSTITPDDDDEPLNLCVRDDPSRFPWNPPGGGLHPLASQLPNPFSQKRCKMSIFKGET